MSPGAPDATRLALEAVERGLSSVVALVVSEGPRMGRRLVLTKDPFGEESVHGTLGDAGADAAVVTIARSALADPGGRDGVRAFETDEGGLEVYLEVRRPVPELVIVGAGHLARPLCRVGAMLGYRVYVLDDRPDFAARERFPDARAVHRVDFSDPFREVDIHERSHVLLVTRGHKYDYECLVRILRQETLPAYVGMIGSRRRVRATFVRLLEDGVSHERIAAVHAPVGLDIGAETPEEIAVAVAAELVMVRRGGTGTSLKDLERVAERYFKDGVSEGSEGETS